MADEPTMRTWQLDPEVGSVVHDVARLMRVSFERRIRQLGLTRTQWWVMTVLLRIEGPTQTELADYMLMERSPLGKVLDILERDGWVQRKPDASDRRVKRIYRTPKIDPFLPALGIAALSVFREATASLDEAAGQRLMDDMRLMRRNLARIVNDPFDLADLSEEAPVAPQRPRIVSSKP